MASLAWSFAALGNSLKTAALVAAQHKAGRKHERNISSSP
jgi:hypothetical protein